MPEILWTIPTHGDPRRSDGHRPARAPSVTDERHRFTTHDHIVGVARAAEAVGFTGVVVPFDPAGEDSWIVAIALARETPRLRIVTEFQPGFATAVYTGKLALSFQRFFADRLGWKPALDLDDAEQLRLGDRVPAGQRLDRAAELLLVLEGIWHDAPYSYAGDFFDVHAGGFFDPTPQPGGQPGQTIARRPYPRTYLDGEGADRIALSARHADVHLFRDPDRSTLYPRIAELHAAADGLGRQVTAGLALTVLSRDDEAEARRDADRLGIDATSAVLGSHEQVAEQLDAYLALGLDTLQLDSTLHIDEAYRLGERVLPLLRVGPTSVPTAAAPTSAARPVPA